MVEEAGEEISAGIARREGGWKPRVVVVVGLGNAGGGGGGESGRSMIGMIREGGGI